MRLIDVLLLVPILTPIAGGLLIGAASGWSARLRSRVTVLTAAIAFTASSVIYYLQHFAHQELSLTFFRLVDYGLKFRPTDLGSLLAVVASALWLLATIYSLVYMKHEHSQSRFFAFLMLSLSGCLGVFLAGDYFTLFLFFEFMTFTAYPLVIHEEDENAMRAGDTYLYMSVAGGLVLLFGILALVWTTGTADIAPALDALHKGNISPYFIALTFIVGFGVKAGIVPLHIWLPQAHPVAPSPASALLSGVMIKTGAYGILSFLTVTLSSNNAHSAYLIIPQNIGYVMIWVALLTMIGGAFMALMQDSIKKILAYSSVSQMGYIMLAIGCAAYLSEEGGLSYTAAVFHAFNHAVFKSGLFLMIGTVYLLTHTLSLSKLGGMSKYLPFTTIATLIASFAVLGMPGFSGFPSKTLIHHAIVEAAQHSQSAWLLLAEKLFVVGSAITAAYFIKLYTGIFFGQYKGDKPPTQGEGTLVRMVLGVFCLAIILVGIFPYQVMHFLESTAHGTVVDLHVLEEQLHHVKFWDVHSYGGVMLPASLGIAIFFIAKYFKFFTWRYPLWLSVEGFIYRPLYHGFLTLCCRYVTSVEGGICELYDRSGSASGRLINRVKRFDDMIDEGYEAMGHATTKLVEEARHIDHGVDNAYNQAGRTVEVLASKVTQVDSEIDQTYARAGRAVLRLTEEVAKADRDIDHVYDNVGNAALKLTESVAKADEKLDHGYDRVAQQGLDILETVRQVDQPKATKTEVDRQNWNPQNITLGSLIVAGLLLIILAVLYFFGGNVL
ncbi:MAG: NADH dehydrogenase (quinone) [Bacillota bacterium]|nr:MAG: NADH dehydrogenase (quinone) [Bacillota bacterium]